MKMRSRSSGPGRWLAGAAAIAVIGAVTVTGGLVALVYGFTRASTDGWDAGSTIGFLVAAAISYLLRLLLQLDALSDDSADSEPR